MKILLVSISKNCFRTKRNTKYVVFSAIKYLPPQKKKKKKLNKTKQKSKKQTNEEKKKINSAQSYRGDTRRTHFHDDTVN